MDALFVGCKSYVHVTSVCSHLRHHVEIVGQLVAEFPILDQLAATEFGGIVVTATARLVWHDVQQSRQEVLQLFTFLLYNTK